MLVLVLLVLVLLVLVLLVLIVLVLLVLHKLRPILMPCSTLADATGKIKIYSLKLQQLDLHVLDAAVWLS